MLTPYTPAPPALPADLDTHLNAWLTTLDCAADTRITYRVEVIHFLR